MIGPKSPATGELRIQATAWTMQLRNNDTRCFNSTVRVHVRLGTNFKTKLETRICLFAFA